MSFYVGKLSQRTRFVRLKNVLTSQEDQLEVPVEETIDDIQEVRRRRPIWVRRWKRWRPLKRRSRQGSGPPAAGGLPSQGSHPDAVTLEPAPGLASFPPTVPLGLFSFCGPASQEYLRFNKHAGSYTWRVMKKLYNEWVFVNLDMRKTLDENGGEDTGRGRADLQEAANSLPADALADLSCLNRCTLLFCCLRLPASNPFFQSWTRAKSSRGSAWIATTMCPSSTCITTTTSQSHDRGTVPAGGGSTCCCCVACGWGLALFPVGRGVPELSESQTWLPRRPSRPSWARRTASCWCPAVPVAVTGDGDCGD